MNDGDLCLLVEAVRHVALVTRFRRAAIRLAQDALRENTLAPPIRVVELDGGIRPLLGLDLVSTETIIIAGWPPEGQMLLFRRWLEKFRSDAARKLIVLVEDAPAARRLGLLAVPFTPPEPTAQEVRDLLAGHPNLEDELTGDASLSDLLSRWSAGELPDMDFLGEWLPKSRHPAEVADLIHGRTR